MLDTISFQNLLRIKKQNKSGASRSRVSLGVKGRQTGFQMSQAQINKVKDSKKLSRTKLQRDQVQANRSNSNQGTKR